MEPVVCVCLERVPRTFRFPLVDPGVVTRKFQPSFLQEFRKYVDTFIMILFCLVSFRVAFASFTSSMASNSTWLIRANKKRLKLLFAIKNSRKLAQISYASLWLCIFRKPTNGKLIKWKLLAKFSCAVRCVWRSWPQHVPRHSFGFLT